MANNTLVLRLLLENGDKNIFFSDMVSSFDNDKETARMCLVTDVAVWLLDKTKDSFTFSRRIPFRDISSTSVSRLSADLLVLHNSKEHDLLVSPPFCRETDICV